MDNGGVPKLGQRGLVRFGETACSAGQVGLKARARTVLRTPHDLVAVLGTGLPGQVPPSCHFPNSVHFARTPASARR